jgi:HTH-type transcriptional regulator/antitoxin HigA
MSKLTELHDDFTIDSSGGELSMTDIMETSQAIHTFSTALEKQRITPWEPSKLYLSAMQSKALYRKHDTAPDSKVILWLAQAQEAARKFFLEHSAMPEFTGISREEVQELAKMSHDSSILPELPEILAHKGIILLYLPAIAGTKIDGAAFLFADKIPVIAHSLRYPRMDNFWFTLLHELAHICLHIDHLDTPIIDDLSTDEIHTKDIEIQADNLAKYSLVSRIEWRTTTVKNATSENEVYDFAKAQRIHPSIVVGLIGHYKKRFDLFSDIWRMDNPRSILGFNE